MLVGKRKLGLSCFLFSKNHRARFLSSHDRPRPTRRLLPSTSRHLRLFPPGAFGLLPPSAFELLLRYDLFVFPFVSLYLSLPHPLLNLIFQTDFSLDFHGMVWSIQACPIFNSQYFVQNYWVADYFVFLQPASGLIVIGRRQRRLLGRRLLSRYVILFKLFSLTTQGTIAPFC